MSCFVGIDLGSTTTKAVVLDEERERPRPRHHQLALELRHRRRGRQAGGARQRALHAVPPRRSGAPGARRTARRLPRPARARLPARAVPGAARRPRGRPASEDVDERPLRATQRRRRRGAGRGVPRGCAAEAPRAVRARRQAKSDFFRDIAGSRVSWPSARRSPRRRRLASTSLLNVYDKCDHRGREPAVYARLDRRPTSGGARARLRRRCRRRAARPHAGPRRRRRSARYRARGDHVVGTGYGRARLPFPKEHIRSEILCHGLGAHVMFPGTRTVLDIGGQDTKAIQVDADGIVESFQMNDRCAAGCGRYLGYIADEMNLGLHELGPLAMKSTEACASTRPARSSPAPSCASACRSARSARTSWPACTARSSCARCRSSRARAASTTSSPSPAASPRTRPRCKRAAAARRRELRRRDAQHQPRLDLHGRAGRRAFAHRAIEN